MKKGEKLLEIYKLHADLTDRVSERRQSSSRIFGGLLVSVLIFTGALVRFGGNSTLPLHFALIGASIIIIITSLIWLISMLSFRELNRLKFIVLHDLETKLPYAFYRKEWSHEHSARKYRVLRTTELLLPIAFVALGIIILVAGCFMVVSA